MTGTLLPGLQDLGKLSEAPLGYWKKAIAWTILFGVAIAIPTVLVRNRFFIRMTPTHWWDYMFWGTASTLGGLVMAAGVLPGRTACKAEKKSVFGVGMTYLAVGCPLCNKLVVALLGTTGALTYFAPSQPVLGILAILLMIHTLKGILQQPSHEAYLDLKRGDRAGPTVREDLTR